MSKTIKIKNKNIFLKNFLLPISKISDSAILETKKTDDLFYITSLSCTSDNSVIFYNEHPVNVDPDDNVSLNCLDVKKLIRAIEAISYQDNLSFRIDKNNLSYEDNDLSFKYHLLEDGIIKKPKIDLNKLQNLDFDTTFNLKNEKIKELIRASVFASDSNKIYISFDDTGVYGDLTDKTKNNIDNMIVKISSEYYGKRAKPIPFSFDIFRIMENANNDIIVKINEKIGIVIFEIQNNYNKMIYIMSALIK
jgi:hypothetical protein